jgi:lysozyme
MRLSEDGADKLKKREARGGVPDLVGYWDDNGKVPTVGWGHTGKDVEVGKTYTVQQCEAWFAADTAWAIEAANRAITNRSITQDQFDAFVSALYNIGPGAEGKRSGLIVLKNGQPSKVLRAINENRMADVPPALMEWVHDGAYPPGGPGDPGLINRRTSEGGQWAHGTFVAGSGPSTQQGSDVKPARQWNVGGLVKIGTAGAGALGGLAGHINEDNVQTAAATATQAAALWHQFGTIAMMLTAVVIVWALFSQKKKS